MAFVPFKGDLDLVDQTQSPQGLKPFTGQLDGVEQDNALTRGISKAKSSAGITSSLITGDAAGAAQKIRDAELYDQRNPGTPEGKQLMQAWEQGDGILGGIKGVAGEVAKDFQEAPGLIGGLRATGKNLSAMGGGLVEQLPNMVAPMGGMIAGGLAGSLAGPVGTVGGAFAGATAGNTLMEGREQVSRALQSAGINPNDTQAVESYLKANGDSILGTAFTKGAIIGGVDTATMGLGNKILRGPVNAAADRALTAMGIDVADKAAVQAAKQAPEFMARLAADAQLKAATTGAQGVARNVGTAALEPAGEFAGEYLGQGVATGDWDTKGAALEAISSLGQSGVTFAGQKAYQAVTNPLRGQQEQATPAIDPNAGPLSKAASMAQQTPELSPLAFTPQQPTGPELETDAQTQERMRAAQFAADALPFERTPSFEQPAQPVRATTQDGMPFERIGPEDYDTLNPIRVGEGELLDRERSAQGQSRAPDAIEGEAQRRIGVADDGQQDQGAPVRAPGAGVQAPQAAQGGQRALPSFVDQKAETAARKALPFANEPTAQKKADELAQKRNEPFTVIPHPALADRFAVVPFRNLRAPNEQGQAAQLAARAQAGQQGAMPRVGASAQQSAHDGSAAIAQATPVQAQPATETVTNDMPQAEQLAQETQASRGQEDSAASDPWRESSIRRGYDTEIEVDALALKAAFERESGEPIAWNQAKADAIKAGAKSNGIPEVAINEGGMRPGSIGINDGRHRIAVAAERGEKIKVMAPAGDVDAVQRAIGQQAPASPANVSLIDKGKTVQPQAQQADAQETQSARGQEGAAAGGEASGIADTADNEVVRALRHSKEFIGRFKNNPAELKKQQRFTAAAEKKFGISKIAGYRGGLTVHVADRDDGSATVYMQGPSGSFLEAGTIPLSQTAVYGGEGQSAPATPAQPQAQQADARVTRDRPMNDGATVTDAEGNQYRVHYQRNDLVVAHPIINGKPQVSADTTVRFWTNPDIAPSGDNDRTDPIYPAPVDPEDAARSSIEREPESWVIRNKETGETVMETFDRAKVDKLNTAKYEAVPILQHLQEVNRKIKTEAAQPTQAPTVPEQSRPAPSQRSESAQQADQFGDANKMVAQPSTPAAQEAQPKQVESFPVNPELESLFESLDGTSTRKANKAKKAIQSDPRADKINMVQDKFLDILQALEDSGAVKINCK